MDVFGIQSKSFQALQEDFGLQLAPRAPLWLLSNVVVPNVWVGQDIFPAINAWPPSYNNPDSAGEQSNPAGGTVLADTGPADGISLPAVFDFMFVTALIDSNGGSTIQAQRRNAANSASIFNFPIAACGGGSNHTDTVVFHTSFSLEPGERVRCINGNALTGTVSVSIFARQRPQQPPFSRPDPF